MIKYILILGLFCSLKVNAQCSISGFIYELESGETLPNVNISILGTSKGTFSNNYGFYSVEIEKGQEVFLQFSSIGYNTVIKCAMTNEDQKLNVILSPASNTLEEIVVFPDNNISINPLSRIDFSIATVKEMPALLGEKDLIKALQLLPGVQPGTEGSSGLYVRGGDAGQNMIILDEAAVYNINHLFGFFSSFNGDAIKTMTFYKSGYPAKYGGRVSSVVDLQMKDGNKEKIRGEAGIGIISSRLILEGPIEKDKSSFLLSVRRTYLDIILDPFMSKKDNFKYRFYDINGKINHKFNENNNFFASVYLGNDRFIINDNNHNTNASLETSSNLNWGNSTLSLRWNHIFNHKLFLNTSLLTSHYQFELSDQYEKHGIDTVKTNSNHASSIRDYTLKMDFDYFISNNQSLNMGLQLTHHRLQPKKTSFFLNSETKSSTDIKENQEFAFYIDDKWTFLKKLQLNTGVRFSGLYTNTKTHFGIEPRVNLIYELPKGITINVSYARMNQYLHLLSNTGLGLPTDLWIPASLVIPPQQMDQITIGASKTFKKPNFTLSIESYRKNINNIIAYNDDAPFLSINDDGQQDFNWEEGVISGTGIAYGTEVYLTKNQERISYTLAYTISWAVHQFNELNNNNFFFPKHDSRHNLSTLVLYDLSTKIKLSVNWVYHSGNALTVPQGFYYGNFALGTESQYIYEPGTVKSELISQQIDGVPYFAGKNSYRGADYHRLDFSIQFYKMKKHYERYWEIGVFNIYNRKNAFYYYLETSNDFKNGGQKLELKKKSLFPIIPSISYNIKFR